MGRGLPYSATVDEVLHFFGSPADLQANNVHLLRRADGRASGDAYVVFDTEEAATQGMHFDKQKLGNRWIDLFRSSKGGLYSLTSSGGIMLPSSNQGMQAPAAPDALGEGYSVVKLRGLPWNVTAEDIQKFLAPVVVPPGGVHLMNGFNGRPSGLAYIELSSDEDQGAALAKDKQTIGGRYIDIFACSQNELQARLAGGLERTGHANVMQSAVSDACFCKLRGLPYQATDQQIMGFFSPLQIVAVQIALNNNGQPSGFGFVQFRTAEDALAALQRSNQVLGSRYVEVFRCSRSDMEQAHMQAMQAAPMMRAPFQQQMHMQRGGAGGHRSDGRSDGAFSAYQAALQTLASRPAHPQFPPNPSFGSGAGCYGSSDPVYNASAAMEPGNYSGPEVAYSTAGSGYGQGGGGYSAPANNYAGSANNYAGSAPNGAT